jgi:hypothetical protein
VVDRLLPARPRAVAVCGDATSSKHSVGERTLACVGCRAKTKTKLRVSRHRIYI